MIMAACSSSKKQITPVNNTVHTTVVSDGEETKKIYPAKSNSKSSFAKMEIMATRIKNEMKGVELQQVGNNLNIILDEQPDKIQLFTGSGSYISVPGKEMLQNFTAILKENKEISVRVSSHVVVGNAATNMALSQRRAKAIGDYFFARGISPHRLMIRWYGETQPIIKGNYLTIKSKNRRMEFFICDVENNRK